MSPTIRMLSLFIVGVKTFLQTAGPIIISLCDYIVMRGHKESMSSGLSCDDYEQTT